MKKIYLLVMCVCTCMIAFSQGIQFEDISVAEALKKAKKERKLVFVDMNATWCGPCKYIAKTLFMEQEVGDFFNTRFINVKCDIDTEEGKALKQKYGVQRIPTFLILQPDGKMRQFMLGGGRRKDEFIAWAKQGLKEKSSLLYLSGMAERGEKMSKQQLSDYLSVLQGQKKPTDTVREQLFNRLSDKERVQAKYWHIFKDQSGDTPYFYYVEEHVEKFRQKMGADFINDYLIQGYENLARGMGMYNKVGDTASIVVIDKAYAILSDIIRGEKGRDEEREESLQKLMRTINLLKAYFHGDRQEMIQTMRTLANAGSWERREWFLVNYIGKYGTEKEKKSVEKIGKFVLLKLTNKNERWSRAREFENYGFSIPYSDKVWEQAKEEAREGNKLLLVQVLDPKDDASRWMDLVLNDPGLSYVVSYLCVPVKDVVTNWETLLTKIQVRELVCPTYLLMTPDEEIVYSWRGKCFPEEFMNFLIQGLAKKESDNLEARK